MNRDQILGYLELHSLKFDGKPLKKLVIQLNVIRGVSDLILEAPSLHFRHSSKIARPLT